MKNCPICQSDEDVAAIEYLEGLLCKREINGPIGRQGDDGSTGAENLLAKGALNDVCLVIWHVLNFIFQFASASPVSHASLDASRPRWTSGDWRWRTRNHIYIMAGRLLVKGPCSATWYDNGLLHRTAFLVLERPVNVTAISPEKMRSTLSYSRWVRSN